MALWIHIAKNKKNYQKEKFHYSDLFLVATVQTPSR
jgi:hypothetical protein